MTDIPGWLSEDYKKFLRPPEEKIRFIRLSEVRATTGMTTSQVYRMQAAGTFPHSVKLGLSTAAWVESEVQAWCRERIEASRSK